MNKKRKILLAVYSALIFIFGLIVVPVKSVWGPSRTLYSCKYTTIWNTVDMQHNINGFNPVNELDLQRIVITLTVLTIITIALYLIFGDHDEK